MGSAVPLARASPHCALDFAHFSAHASANETATQALMAKGDSRLSSGNALAVKRVVSGVPCHLIMASSLFRRWQFSGDRAMTAALPSHFMDE
jgi:hypothetical protein